MADRDTTDRGSDSRGSVRPDASEGRDLLQRFEQKWSVAGDLASEASVQSVDRWDATKEIVRTLTVTESTEPISVPPADSPERESAVPMAERYDHSPDGFEAETVEFVDFAGASLVRCSNCGGAGREGCSTCDRRTVVECDECRGDGVTGCGGCAGTGSVECGSCGGSGTTGSSTCSRCNGAGEVACDMCNASGNRRCPKCDGGGEVRCPNCAGDGDVPCGTCSGSGELYETTGGTLEWEPDSSYTVEDARGADSDWFADAEGDRLSNAVRDTPDRADESGSAIVRHEVEERTVPVTRVTYEYDGSEYDLFEVERTLHSRSSPDSTTRRLLPIVVGLAIAAAGGYYYVFVL